MFDQLSEAMETMFDGSLKLFKSAEKSPVTLGGLKLYTKQLPAKLPPGYWYIYQDEDFDEDQHSDLLIPDHFPRRVKPGAIKYNAFDKRPEASDRIVVLMSNTPERAIKCWTIPMTFQVEAKYPGRLTLNLQHSFEAQAEHGPLRDEDANVKSCFTGWPQVFADLPDRAQVQAAGFVERKRKDWVGRRGTSKSWFDFHGIVEMQASDDKDELKVTLALFRPDTHLTYRLDQCKCTVCYTADPFTNAVHSW